MTAYICGAVHTGRPKAEGESHGFGNLGLVPRGSTVLVEAVTTMMVSGIVMMVVVMTVPGMVTVNGCGDSGGSEVR